MSREEELAAREKALEEREKNLERKERELGAFSAAVREKKEEWYDRVRLSEKQLTVIIRVVYALLGLVAVLIILEAAGIFKL
ncbi:MAG: hypothetical protein K5922_07385 [Clostridiales bacterium]|nr:hypothetical protein [Clostridiales bacterium]